MIIVREATQQQISKVEQTLFLEELHSESTNCSGECWDCDGCGGSVTH